MTYFPKLRVGNSFQCFLVRMELRLELKHSTGNKALYIEDRSRTPLHLETWRQSTEKNTLESTWMNRVLNSFFGAKRSFSNCDCGYIISLRSGIIKSKLDYFFFMCEVRTSLFSTSSLKHLSTQGTLTQNSLWFFKRAILHTFD